MNELIKKIINKKGIIRQSFVAVEELAELQQAISKCVRLHDTDEYVSLEARRNLMEEIADVLIMIEQLKVMYSITDTDIQAWIDSKLDRLEERYL